MDIKQLLEKMEEFAGEKVGQKPGDQWRGSDKAPPGKKLVGDSILKDLSKGKSPKSKEQELAEEFQAFSEAEFKDTVAKRPSRKGARHSRGHEPKLGYKNIKADESSMSEKDIELQDYHSMSHKEFQTAYGMTKTEWINKNKALVIKNPDIKKSLGINESHYKWVISFKDGKQAIYHQKSPHYNDATAASDIEYTLKSNPGAQIELATKDDKAFNWQSLLAETNDNNAVEARWMVKVSDDEGDHLKTYHKKFPSLSAAKKAYKKYEPYASDFKYTPVKKDQVEEAVYTAPKTKDQYDAKMAALQDLQTDPNTENDPELQKKIIIYMDNLQKIAHQKGWATQPAEESRGHKIVATKLKDIERAKKFASGELKIPTPQERQAQLKKLETEPKQVKELMAPQDTANQTMQQKTQAQDPIQAQAVAQATQAMKSAAGISAPATTLAKALDNASQGKPVQGQEADALEPLMKDMATVAQDPKLAGQFKNLVNQINQAQLKQK